MNPKVDEEYRSYAALESESGAAPQSARPRRLASVVHVRLERSRRTGRYKVEGIPVQPGDIVVVETDRGTALGKVLDQHRKIWLAASEKPSRLIRRFSDKDHRNRERQIWREKNFRRDCVAAATEFGLDLKIASAEYLHWENRVVFYFVSEGRVDFRDLVRELSRKLRCRVEMRQIGPRDETRLVGGIGTCGREFCCSTHLVQFESIRIRMVKEQGLVMNPQKVSGGCGKLKCCLAYEVDVYRELRKGMPGMGKLVKSPDGTGKVREVNVLTRRVGVLVEGAGYKSYPVAVLSNIEGVPFDPEGMARHEAEEAEERVRRQEIERGLLATPAQRPGRDDNRSDGEGSRRSKRRRSGRSGPPKDGQAPRKPRPPKEKQGRPDGARPSGDSEMKKRPRRRRGRRSGGQGGGGGASPSSG